MIETMCLHLVFDYLYYMKIAFFSTQPYDREYFELYRKEHFISYYTDRLNSETVNLATGYDAVCAFVNDHLHERILTTLAGMGIKLVAMRCAGYNNVDIVAAKKLGITVVRVPAYSPYAVAEHAVALMMTLNRKTHKAYNRVREGNFSLDRLIGFDLFGKTAGIISTGKIGQCLAKILLGFGCKVVAYDLFESEAMVAAGVTYMSFDDLLAQSDIVSLHCPLTEDTRHIINERSLGKMKKGAMLINTSRGGLIDTHAAIVALKSGQLGYLGIDVYEQEGKLFFRDLSEDIIEDEVILRLMSFPNVLITAHQGFLTDEALTQIALVTLNNVDDFKAGKELINRVD
jgi:D-lactate dehydrogenase